MFFNKNSLFKGTTKVLQPVLHYFNDRSDKALVRARAIFGIEAPNFMGYKAPIRCTTSTVATKAFNFTRQDVVQTGLGGFRCELKRIPYSVDYLDPDFRAAKSMGFKQLRKSQENKVDPMLSIDREDLFAAYQLLKINGVSADGCVAIIQYKRIVADTKESLAQAVRSLSASEDMIRNIELDFNNPIKYENNDEGFYRDLLFITLIHESDLNEYPAVLDGYSGVQLSFMDISTAPAYKLEQYEGFMPEGSGDDLRERRASVASYVINYREEIRPPFYVRDGGCIVNIPQVQSSTREEGLYKTWYEYVGGRIRTREEFTPMKQLKPHNGFFHTRVEAQLWAPDELINEFKDNLTKIMSRYTSSLNGITSRAIAETNKRLVSVIETVFKTVVEDVKVCKKLEEQINDLREQAKRRAEEHAKQIDDMRRDADAQRRDTTSINNILKTVQVLAGTMASVFAIIRPKKKPA